MLLWVLFTMLLHLLLPVLLLLFTLSKHHRLRMRQIVIQWLPCHCIDLPSIAACMTLLSKQHRTCT
jgi:hypothetical protein